MFTALIAAGLMALDGLPVSYSVDLNPGQSVDLSQGYYVCKMDNPRDAMGRLIQIQNPTKRWQTARMLGCNFVVYDNLPWKQRQSFIHKIKRQTATICLDKRNDGEGAWCGREGHQLVVDRGYGVEQVVIWLSLDHDME